MDLKYGQRSERYNLQPRKERNYAHLFMVKNDAQTKTNARTAKNKTDHLNSKLKTTDSHDDNQNTVMETSQMNKRQGLKFFGSNGVDAVKKRNVTVT